METHIQNHSIQSAKYIRRQAKSITLWFYFATVLFLILNGVFVYLYGNIIRIDGITVDIIGVIVSISFFLKLFQNVEVHVHVV